MTDNAIAGLANQVSDDTEPTAATRMLTMPDGTPTQLESDDEPHKGDLPLELEAHKKQPSEEQELSAEGNILYQRLLMLEAIGRELWNKSNAIDRELAQDGVFDYIASGELPLSESARNRALGPVMDALCSVRPDKQFLRTHELILRSMQERHKPRTKYTVADLYDVRSDLVTWGFKPTNKTDVQAWNSLHNHNADPALKLTTTARNLLIAGIDAVVVEGDACWSYTPTK